MRIKKKGNRKVGSETLLLRIPWKIRTVCKSLQLGDLESGTSLVRERHCKNTKKNKYELRKSNKREIVSGNRF